MIEKDKAKIAWSEEESRALQEVGISLTETIDINAVLYRILQAALNLVHGDEASIIFFDGTRDEFGQKALICQGPDEPLCEYQTQVRQRAGLAYEIVQQGKPVIISDTLLDLRTNQVTVGKGRRAMVGVPLQNYDGPVGVLWVSWKAPRPVSSREASLLTALGGQATVVITAGIRWNQLRHSSE
jgi:GAF domain-containing protein